MLACLRSAAVLGVDAYPVSVEVDVQFGLPLFAMVGLPDATVRESRDRVRAAIKNAGFNFPEHRITVNLAPADVRKAGSSFELAIALGLLAHEDVLKREAIARHRWCSASCRSTAASTAFAACWRSPWPRAGSASSGCCCRRETLRRPASSTAWRCARCGRWPRPLEALNQPDAATLVHVPTVSERADDGTDLADIRGQAVARRAIEVAAAGGHNLLMTGPPGAGKTMLARRIPGVLPEMTFDEAVECTKIHSIAGQLPADVGLLIARPFRAPHHSISNVALVGGGSIPAAGRDLARPARRALSRRVSRVRAPGAGRAAAAGRGRRRADCPCQRPRAVSRRGSCWWRR